jgi:hypothetical protein
VFLALSVTHSPHDSFRVVDSFAQLVPGTAAVVAYQLVPVGVHAEGGGPVLVGFPAGAVVEVVGVLVVVGVVACQVHDVVPQVQRNEIARFHHAVEIQVVQSFAGVVPNAAPQHLGGPLLFRLVPADGRIHSHHEATVRPRSLCSISDTLATALMAALLAPGPRSLRSLACRLSDYCLRLFVAPLVLLAALLPLRRSVGALGAHRSRCC